MAARASAKARSGTKTKKGRVINGVNGITLEDLREYFDEIHELTDGMEEASARARGKINEVYEKASSALDITKEAAVLMFKQERKEKKSEAKARKMDSRSRESLEKLSQAYGEDSPFGEWAARMARIAASEQARVASGDSGED